MKHKLPRRMGIAGYLILAAAVLGLVDETLRKALPGAPVEVTGVKLALLLLAVSSLPRHSLRFLGRGPWVLWCLFVVSSSVITYSLTTSLLHWLACLSVYLGPVGAFCAGRHIASNRVLRFYMTILGAVGLTVAVTVALAQEFARDSLPGWLTRRVYKESHSLAGGDYVESIFASPTVAAVFFLLGGLITLNLFFHSPQNKWLSGSLAVGCCAALLCTRIRAGVVLYVFAVLTMVAIPVLLGARGALSRIASSLMGTAWVSAAVLVFLWPAEFQLSSRYQHDVHFFMTGASAEELAKRAADTFQEASMLSEEVPLFGYGLGTSGALRNLLPDHTPQVPLTLDSGIFLMLVEGGSLGFSLLLVLLIWLLFHGRPLATAGGRLDPLALSCWIGAISLTAWFFLKSHAIMGNAFCQMLWFGCIGLSCQATTARPGNSFIRD